MTLNRIQNRQFGFTQTRLRFRGCSSNTDGIPYIIQVDIDIKNLRVSESVMTPLSDTVTHSPYFC